MCEIVLWNAGEGADTCNDGKDDVNHTPTPYSNRLVDRPCRKWLAAEKNAIRALWSEQMGTTELLPIRQHVLGRWKMLVAAGRIAEESKANSLWLWVARMW